MRLSKTKLMTIRSEDKVTIQRDEIAYVDEYIYLGQVIAKWLKNELTEEQQTLGNVTDL